MAINLKRFLTIPDVSKPGIFLYDDTIEFDSKVGIFDGVKYTKESLCTFEVLGKNNKQLNMMNFENLLSLSEDNIELITTIVTSNQITRNKMVNELMRAQGAAAASGGPASQSRARAVAINTLGEFGREQTEFNKSLYSARAAYKQRMGAISGAHANADYTAWTKVAVPPALQMHGAITLPGPTPTKAPSPSGGFFSDVMGGIGAGISTFGALGGGTGGFWNKPGK